MAAPLVVLSPDKALLIDRNPDTDFLLQSTSLRLAYGLTSPTSVYTWPRSGENSRGFQPVPEGGRKVYFKTGSVEPPPGEDRAFWLATESLFDYARNEAVQGEETGWNQFREMLKKVTYVMMGFFVLAVLVWIARNFDLV